MNVSKFRAVAFSGSALAMAGFVSTAAQAENWNLSVWGKSRAGTAHIEALAAEVSKKTGGKFKIKIHYGGLSKPKENLDGIKIGAFEMAITCGFFSPGKNPTIAGLDLPFLPIADLGVRRAVEEAYINHPAVAKDLARWNAKIVIGSVLPQYEFMGTGKPPMKLSDWKGLRARVGGGIAKAMMKLGMVPSAVPSSEVYQLLERGTIDAVGFPPYAFAAFKVSDISKWFTRNMSLGTVFCPTIVGLKAYNKLSKEYQDILMNARFVAYDVSRARFATNDKKVVPQFRKAMQEIRYDDATMADFRKIAAKPVWDDWVKEATAKGVPAQELLDLILATAKKASN